MAGVAVVVAAGVLPMIVCVCCTTGFSTVIAPQSKLTMLSLRISEWAIGLESVETSSAEIVDMHCSEANLSSGLSVTFSAFLSKFCVSEVGGRLFIVVVTVSLSLGIIVGYSGLSSLLAATSI